ncbi:MAG: nuclear transport factor 2 family protein [Betaproteobacteria bacterium]
MRRRRAFAFLCMVALTASAQDSRVATAADTPATTAVRKMLAIQDEAWNRGDIEGFMQYYWKNESIRFAGGDSFRYGWQATLDSYKKGYPDAAAMGQLSFDPLEIREINPDMVYVFGRWKLTRANEAAQKAPRGLFTLIVEKKDGAWVITRDHSSAAGG